MPSKSRVTGSWMVKYRVWDEGGGRDPDNVRLVSGLWPDNPVIDIVRLLWS